MNWNGKRVLVTGGAGFIGRHLVDRLARAGATVTVADDLSRGKLENLQGVPNEIFYKVDLSDPYYADTFPDLMRDAEWVFALAAHLGGVGYMNAQQARVFTPNVLMNTLTLEAARKAGVPHYLYMSTACVYRQDLQVDADALLSEIAAYPSWPDATYGWTKLLGEIQAYHYARDYGMDIKIPRLFNVYGPYEDFSVDRSHVIPSLMRKARAYPGEPFRVWGTGSQTRAFLYVDDAVDGILLMAEKGPSAEPVNIGSDQRVTIRELAQRVVAVSGKDIPIEFDPSMPEGVHGRAADRTLATQLLGWEPKVGLQDGLRLTWDWYVRETE